MQCDLSWALGGIRLRQLLLEWVLDTDGEHVYLLGSEPSFRRRLSLRVAVRPRWINNDEAQM